MPQLLLELFSEEIPARMQAGAARDLERMASERLTAAGLSWDALTTYAGPRRLTLVVDGLPTATPDRSEELKGPRANAPEQALDGFLRKTGLTRDQLTERDGVLFAVIQSQGVPTTTVIAETVEQIIRTFPWPKSMRWGPRSKDSGTLRWVRPLKRILCLFDGAVVPFQIDGIHSGDVTEGHRFLGTGQPFAVTDFMDYRARLEADFVLLDAADRKRRILQGARAVCQAQGLDLVEDDGLLEEVAGLAEWPTPILGDMDPQFLDLPAEVIRLSMKTHQKYFAVAAPPSEGRQTDSVSPPLGGNTREAGEGGRSMRTLAPNFIVVANVEASDGGVALASGNSRVLSARLNDARFFWDEDRKVGFGAWLEKLQGVTFHAKLGTMAERVDRVAALAREIATVVGADPDLAFEAARLSKADLASSMVGEFPELQGVMGGYYARAAVDFPTRAPLRSVVPPHLGEGESTPDLLPPLYGEGQAAQQPGWGSVERDAIADAIRDHYKPQGPADSVPTAPLTVAVALADKLDTLVGFFAIDEKPTGSKDPFALRRAALGVIRLVLENGILGGYWYALRIARLTPVANALTSGVTVLEASERARLAHAALMLMVASYDLLPSQVRDAIAGMMSSNSKFDAAVASQPAYAKALDDVSNAVVVENEKYRKVEKDLLAFFADRLKVLLRDQGKRHDIVDAVLVLGDDLVRTVWRVEALDAFLATEDGVKLLASYRRASNILKAEARKGEVAADTIRILFDQPEAQVRLRYAYEEAYSDVGDALARDDFAGAMTALAVLREPVDDFFADVLVNSDDPEERAGRLNLLGRVRDLMNRVADFGMVAG